MGKIQEANNIERNIRDISVCGYFASDAGRKDGKRRIEKN